MLKRRIASFINKFDAIAPSWHQNQDQGIWKDEEQDTKPVSCCFGAAVAKAYDRSCNVQQNKYIFKDGFRELSRHLNLRVQDVNSLLWLCGAGQFPFSADNWESSPAKVFSNLAKIEHQPTRKEFGVLDQARAVHRRHSTEVEAIWNRITTDQPLYCVGSDAEAKIRINL